MLCPPPSTGALTRLQRYNVSDIGGIPAFDTTPLDTSTPAGSWVSNLIIAPRVLETFATIHLSPLTRASKGPAC